MGAILGCCLAHCRLLWADYDHRLLASAMGAAWRVQENAGWPTVIDRFGYTGNLPLYLL